MAGPTTSPTRRGDEAADRSLAARLVLGSAAAAAAAVPFTLLLLLVLSEWEPLARLDRAVADDLNTVARGNDALVAVLEVVAVVTDPWTLRAVLLVVVAWLWQRGARRLAAWAITTAVVGGLLSPALKVLVERARPTFPEPVASAGGYSFPSGHALNSVLIAGILLLIFLPVLGRLGRVMAYVGATVLVLLTGYDRIALGVHFVSDVVAGWVVALATLVGTATAFEVWRREQGRPPSPPSEGIEPESAPMLDSDTPVQRRVW